MRKNRTKMSIWRCSTKCRTLWGSGWSSCRATRLTFRTNSNNNSSSLTTPGNPMLSNPPPKNFQSGRAPVLSQLSQIHNKYKSKKSQRNMLQTNNRRNLQQLWLSILLHSNHPKPHQTKSFGISNSPAATLHLPSNRLRIERGQQSRLLQICSGRSKPWPSRPISCMTCSILRLRRSGESQSLKYNRGSRQMTKI